MTTTDFKARSDARMTEKATRAARNEALSNEATRTKISRCYAGTCEDMSVGIVAETRSGARFTLEHMFPTLDRAQRFAAKVTAKGSIDTGLWNELEPIYGTTAYLAKSAEAMSYRIAMREGYATIDIVPEDLRAYL